MYKNVFSTRATLEDTRYRRRVSALPFACGGSLISILKWRRFTPDITVPQFPSPRLKHAAKASHSLPGWHVFHAGDEQFSAITTEG